MSSDFPEHHHVKSFSERLRGEFVYQTHSGFLWNMIALDECASADQSFALP